MTAHHVPAPAVSVVICAHSWDRAHQLLDAARSVMDQTHAPAEVIVVIDHAPGLQAWAEREIPFARVVANTGSPGLACARNTGVTAATSELVAFLDDDARAGARWLECLVAPFADPSVGATGGAVLPEWQTGRPRWMPEEFDWVVGCSYRGLPLGLEPVRNVIGCSMAFRREAIVAAGGFAAGLGRRGSRPLGCEETDLCIRLQAQELQVVYTPSATVCHRVPRNRATVWYFVSRCRAEGVSKREVRRRNGAQRALSSERRYVTRTLPRGVIAELRRGSLTGMARAAMIGLGLAATGAGYIGAARS